MSQRRVYTFIVSPHAEARLWRFSLSYAVLAALGLSVAIGAAAAGLGFYHYGSMLLKVKDYEHLLAENNSFRSENHDYRIQTAQLGEKLDLLETMSMKVRRLAGVDDPGSVGGVGGFSKDSFNRTLRAPADPLQSIDAYNRRMNELENEFRNLEQSLESAALTASSSPTIQPVPGYITGGMGRREDPFNGARMDHHVGVDISAPLGRQVVATADGIVIYAGLREGYGNIVVIDHKFGWSTRYGHLSKVNVQIGQRVSRKDTVGYVGMTGRTTGPHLHYEMWYRNTPQNPLKYLLRGQRNG